MNNIIKGISAGVLAIGISACSGDYLEQKPYEQFPAENLSQSVGAFEAGLNGLCQTMYIYWSSSATERYGNGEGYFQSFYGDSPSPDFAFTWLWGTQAQYQAWILMQQDNRSGGSYAWQYNYALINQANNLLAQVDLLEASDAQKDFFKAQALTMRAHAYIHLMQVYGPRYEDSENGSKLCVVLRLEPSQDPMPLSDYKTVIAQIYKDLDDAISLFESSGMRRSQPFHPDINVAKGIYSRIALLNHDWAKAQTMAHEARQGYPIMSAEDYKAGFADPTSEWIWYNNRDKSNNGYQSWGASFTANGNYCAAYTWAGAGGQISYDLYKEVYNKNNTDVRCELFWTPMTANKYYDFGIKEEDFWSDSNLNTAYMNMWLVNPVITEAITLWVKNNKPENFHGAFGIDDEDLDLYDWDSEGYGNSENNQAVLALLQSWGYQDMVQFGAQMKFFCYNEDLGDTSHSFLRASELLLTEAEAALEQNDEATAKSCLEELNNNRMDSYTCDLSGDDLKKEVRLYRRIELWGEGDTWFSMKRWNETVTRKRWVKGDVTSGNFLSAYQGTYAPDFANGWTYQIPRIEKDYNQLINSQLNEN